MLWFDNAINKSIECGSTSIQFIYAYMSLGNYAFYLKQFLNNIPTIRHCWELKLDAMMEI